MRMSIGRSFARAGTNPPGTRRSAGRQRLRRIGAALAGTSLALGTLVLQEVAIPLTARGFNAPSAVTDVNPNSLTAGTLFGGRTVNFAVNPINTQIVFAATEFGGLWRSNDGGNTWAKAPGGSDVCSSLAQNNGREIAIAPGTPGSLTVLVGTD